MFKFDQPTKTTSLIEIIGLIRDVNQERTTGNLDKDPTETVRFYHPEQGYLVVMHPAYGLIFLDYDLDTMGIYPYSDFGDTDHPQLPDDLVQWYTDGNVYDMDAQGWLEVTVGDIPIKTVS